MMDDLTIKVIFTIFFIVLFLRESKLSMQVDRLELEQEALRESLSMMAELLAKDRRADRK